MGSGITSRVGNRPATLPGLGERRPAAGQLPVGERRDQLRQRLTGDGGIRDGVLGDGERPTRDWDQVRQDWSDHRDDLRDNWQDYRDDARDDWQNWHDDQYPWHAGWYWGSAPGYWGRWDYLWDEYPVAAAAGLTWWTCNRLGYAFGYEDYYNPYYEQSMPAYYSEPLVREPVPSEAPADAGQPPQPSQDALEKFDQARTAFAAGKYEEAWALLDQALALLPQDAAMHEFRSLVLFALKRYNESSAAIYAVLAVGPGWDWKTLSGLYPQVSTYEAQLRDLEGYCQVHSDAADAHFLLGYHYLTTGATDEALAEFRRVTELEPKDAVSASLVRSLSPRDTQTQPPPAPAAAAPAAIPAADLLGTWNASGKDGDRFTLVLDEEGKFTWGYSRGSRTEDVKGVYVLKGNVLALEPDTGGTMLAELTMKVPGQMHFQMIGGEQGDPGLDFQRGQ